VTTAAAAGGVCDEKLKQTNHETIISVENIFQNSKSCSFCKIFVLGAW
jgi:hypothetical protein